MKRKGLFAHVNRSFVRTVGSVQCLIGMVLQTQIDSPLLFTIMYSLSIALPLVSQLLLLLRTLHLCVPLFDFFASEEVVNGLLLLFREALTHHLGEYAGPLQ